MKKEQNKTSIKYFFFGILLIITYQIILPLIYSLITSPLDEINNFWISNFTPLGYYLIVTILLCILFKNSLKIEAQDFLKNKKSYIKKAFATWGKGILFMILSNIIIMQIATNIAGNEEQNRMILQELPIFAIITMCFIGPFIEELLFRKSFKGAFHNKYIYATITALIFASLHVINGFESYTLQNILTNWTQLLYFIPYGSLAFFFGLTYYETNNIFISTLAHCFHNTLSIILILISGILI